MADDTVFDKILDGKIPCETVYEDEDVLAFKDLNPQAPAHVLVIPKKKVKRFQDLAQITDEECGRFVKGVARAAASLNLNDPGFRIVFNNGKDGGQEVEYLHAHILGGRRLNWPPG